jgi:hypothetical protein
VQSFKPTEFQLEILRVVSQVKDFILKEKIITMIGRPRVKTEYEIDELLKIGLLKDTHDFNGETLIGLNHEGRRVLLEVLGDS